MNRIVLATTDAAYEKRVRDAFGGTLNGELSRWSDEVLLSDPGRALTEVEENAPDVVALGPGLSLEAALSMAERLDRDRPEIAVLLVATPTPELWEQALKAGVRDIVPPDADSYYVRQAFDRALEIAGRRRASVRGDTGAAGSRVRVITVLSPKGGSGKTTVATNLAVGLAPEALGRVALIDLDLQFGDVANALGMTPEQTIIEAVRAGVREPLELKVFLSSHSAGFYALCAPTSIADSEDIAPEAVGHIVEMLSSEFAYVVIDTSAGISEHTLAALEVSTDLVLVCGMDVPSVRSLRKEIEALDQLGMLAQRRHFVLNRADARVGLDVRDVEAAVGMRVDVAVSSSRAVPLSMNQGTPLLESDPRSSVARQLSELVNRFTEQPAKTTRRGRHRRMR